MWHVLLWCCGLVILLLSVVLGTTDRGSMVPSSRMPVAARPWSAAEGGPGREFLCSDLYLSLADGHERLFVKTDVLHTGPVLWRGQWHAPRIDRQVVLSGQSDYAVTPDLAARFPGVKHWFAINNQSLDSRVTTLPLGLTNDTDESPIHRIFGNQEVLRQVLAEPKPTTSVNWVYLNLAMTHPSRQRIWQLFHHQSWVTVGINEASLSGRQAFLRAIRQHEFCLCPRGNGLDTHRLWETLYVGSIPIVEYDPAYHAFRDLPIYFIQDWATDVTLEQLQAVKVEMTRRCWNRDKLFFPYWRQTITLYPQLAQRIPSDAARHQSWVLIHLGPPAPAYMQDCVQQITRVDPTSTVFVVADQDPGYGTWLPLSEVPLSSWRQQFLETSTINSSDRQGFWKWACLRLFVLHDVMEYVRLRNVMHLEYDNLVYFDLSWFRTHLPDTARWACPRLGPHRLLANLLFVRDPEPLRALLGFINSRSLENEMRYLSEFQASTDVYPFYELPLTRDHPHFAAFDSIFDAAALGQCLGGVDPRNQPGNTVGFVNEDSPWPDLKPSWLTWNADHQPLFRTSCIVRNLHIHSKQLSKFC